MHLSYYLVHHLPLNQLAHDSMFIIFQIINSIFTIAKYALVLLVLWLKQADIETQVWGPTT